MKHGMVLAIVMAGATLSAGGAFGASFGADSCALVPPKPEPNKPGILRCEQSVARSFSRLLKSLLKCNRDAAVKLAKGGRSDEAACDAAARREFDRSVNDVRSDCPGQCALENAGDLADWAAHALDQRSSQLFCSDGKSVVPTRLTMTPVSAGASCGGPAFDPPAGPPFAGAVASADGSFEALGLGCTYFGDGRKSAFSPPSFFLGDAPLRLAVGLCETGDTLTLEGLEGAGPASCTQGAGPAKHCLGAPGFTGNSCNDDGDCGDVAGSCNRDARCYTTPPIPNPSGFGACLVNVFESDLTGTVKPASGDFQASFDLATRVYLTGDTVHACPRCLEGRCDGGPRRGLACTAVGEFSTSVDCLPAPDQFFGTVRESIAMTTGVVVKKADESGAFCPGQQSPGAFGLPSAQTIVQYEAPAGDLRDGETHEVATVIDTCLTTDNPVIKGIAGFPAPLATAQAWRIRLD